MKQYWVCKKSDDHSNSHGEWVSDFKSMRHYFYLFSNEKDGEAEIWDEGFFNDINVTEEFKDLNRRYIELKKGLIKELNEKWDISFEE